jgi:hypothetical protein
MVNRMPPELLVRSPPETGGDHANTHLRVAFRLNCDKIERHSRHDRARLIPSQALLAAAGGACFACAALGRRLAPVDYVVPALMRSASSRASAEGDSSLFERQMRVSPRQDVRAAWPSTIDRWPPALFVISTRRGFAASATGILSVSTPWS